ncbi:toprim domain-containing protein [Pseudolabrys sp. FHR47]|uniref:toprim domain-containing protein n=1 Tax=Pseudolabrys sp. FHR47 TaxID=2562284 RepID=UPI001FEEACA7|nr:toprim domain-containing protein [Pseudolabrys sp. FHR47]
MNWLMDSSPLRPRGINYLTGRGFSEVILRRFGIGQVESASALLEAAQLRWTLDELKQTGLVTDTYGQARLIFRNHTILFPFLDQGAIRYVQGRAANDSDKPRWINLAGIQKPLFNVDAIKSHPRSDFIHLCEGITDTIAAAQLGLTAVGVLGAHSLTPDHAELFSGMKVTLLPDGDRGGDQFERHALALLRRFNANVSVLRVPRGTDIADQIRPKKD